MSLSHVNIENSELEQALRKLIAKVDSKKLIIKVDSKY